MATLHGTSKFVHPVPIARMITITPSPQTSTQMTEIETRILSPMTMMIAPKLRVHPQDRHGCVDGDGDGWSDWGDAFPDEGSQWSDQDQDGFGDNPNGVNGDQCAIAWGDSFEDRYGCPDRDNDGWSDPDNWGEWGPVWTTADGADAFWEDATQWSDYDVDGYGDNWADPEWNDSHEEMGVGQFVENATTPDFCPLDTGYSYQDRNGLSRLRR